MYIPFLDFKIIVNEYKGQELEVIKSKVGGFYKM